MLYNSNFLAFSTAHRVWGASFVILSGHLFLTSTGRIHIGNVCDFARWAARSALLLSIWAICRLNAADLLRVSARLRAITGHLGGFRRFGGLCHLGLLLGRDVIHDSGNLHELRLGELAEDGLEFWTLDQTCQLEVVLGAVLHVRIRVARVINQVPAPYRLLNRESLALIRQLNTHRNVNSRWGQQTRLVLVHFRV